MKIRESIESDLNELVTIQHQAFGRKEGPEVAGLVEGLLKDPTAMPLLSLVAVSDNQPIGHVLFTQSRVTGTKREVSSVILAPLAVIPEKQRQKVGGRLIEEGLRRLLKAGIDLVFVLGHPDYYPRYGFRPAGALGFQAPYPIPEKNAGAWMVQELVAGAIESTGGGKVFCATAMDKPEYWRE